MPLEGMNTEVALARELDTAPRARQGLWARLAEEASTLPYRLMELHVAGVPEAHDAPALPGNELHELGVVGDDVVLDVVTCLLAEGREEPAGALNLGFLDTLELESREGALGLG